MKNSNHLLKLVFLAMMIALGVVISPFLRVEGMCPMAHFINVTCSVLLGPWYSLLCAMLIGIIRMAVMAIPPIALTGAVFGAFLSGLFYRLSRGNILMAVLGEIFGTGIIGAVLSYPVMTFLWGRDGLSWLFYIPSFVCGTLIGGSIAFVFLKKLASNGVLSKLQNALGSGVYVAKESVLADSVSIAALGAISFVVFSVLGGLLSLSTEITRILSFGSLGLFIAGALVYAAIRLLKRRYLSDSK